MNGYMGSATNSSRWLGFDRQAGIFDRSTRRLLVSVRQMTALEYDECYGADHADLVRIVDKYTEWEN